jgi:hypothetical protein
MREIVAVAVFDVLSTSIDVDGKLTPARARCDAGGPAARIGLAAVVADCGSASSPSASVRMSDTATSTGAARDADGAPEVSTSGAVLAGVGTGCGAESASTGWRTAPKAAATLPPGLRALLPSLPPLFFLF